MDPSERSPVGVRDFDYADGEKEEERKYCESNTIADCGFRIADCIGRRCRSILPTQPEKIGGKEGDEPAVAVLVVKRPFAAEVLQEDEPERAEDGDGEEQHWRDGTLTGRCGFR